jgi:ATP-dependent Clp protease ATP-binding subunit ClpX
MSNTKMVHCTFCGKCQTEVKRLIAGPDCQICDECVQLCHDIIVNELGEQKPEVDTSSVPSPHELKEYLDQYIIGQDHAKRVLSVAVYNHYKRINNNALIDGVEIDKGNIFVCGPSGTGKTLLAQTIAKRLDVPIAICDATTLTESGYVGDDVESIIARLLQVADYDIEKTQRGIIFIDEIDKKSKRGDNASITRDVSGEGVQQALLKIIEGTECRVPPQGGRKHPSQEMITVNTKNILFIVSGAFVGMDKVVAKRVTKQASIGFGAEVVGNKKHNINEMYKQVESEDIIKYGLIPEMVGRLPVIAYLEELSEEQLVQVLTEPKNAIIKQYQAIFKLDGVELVFTEQALLEIAKIATTKQTGARGLRAIIEKTLMKIQFDLPELKKEGAERIVVTDHAIKGETSPEIVYEQVAA